MRDFPTMRRLHDRGPASRGLTVDSDGAMLGPDCMLIRRTGDRYRIVNPVEVAAILRFAFGHGRAFDGLTTRLGGIARALEEGQLAKAQILGLQLPFETLDDEKLRRLDVGVALVKDGYDPNQARDGRGRWTGDGGTSGSGGRGAYSPPVLEPAPAAMVTAGEAGATRSLWNTVSRLTPEFLQGLARTLAAPLAFAGGVLIPSNDSNIHEGEVPGAPGVGYRSDEGVLTLFRPGPDGTGQAFYTGFPDSNGFYHDAAGAVIGRKLGTALMLDTSALSTLAIGAPLSPSSRRDENSDNPSVLPGSAAANDDDQPQICPNPSPEGIKGRSERSLAYQEQITGLPRGVDVVLRGVRFDGCDERTGHMIEAKGPGLAWALHFMSEDWLRTKWEAYPEIMGQAAAQSQAAAGRIVEWHFADKIVADYFRNEFAKAGYSGIRVLNTEAIVKSYSDSRITLSLM